MPFTQIATDRITSGTALSLLGDDHDGVVLPGVTVASSGASGISATASSHDITVFGTVSGAISGIRLGDSAASDAGNTLRLGDDAVVYGREVGVNFTGRGGSVTNRGDIYGDGIGIAVNGGAGTVDVRSYDLVTARIGVDAAGSAADTVVRFLNSGTLDGDVLAYRGGNGVDRFINQGRVEGDVLLRGGDDTYQERGYSDEAYTVDLGIGNDTLVLRNGLYELTAVGGNGFDTLELIYSNDELVLGGGQLDGFERVLGSDRSDYVTGSGIAETLFGGEGSDQLRGGGGGDLIDGGEHGDTIYGGNGNDSFRFRSLDDDLWAGTDRIADWNNVAPDDDTLVIDASGFGGGLVAGTPLTAAEFQTGGDNVALTSSIRFIWETDNRILWFDEDGNGAAAARVVAQFGGAAPVTEGDILIVA